MDHGQREDNSSAATAGNKSSAPADGPDSIIAAPPPPPAPPAETKPTRGVATSSRRARWLNFFAYFLLIAFWSWWIHEFTGWFQTIATVAAGGGIVSLLVSAAKVIPESWAIYLKILSHRLLFTHHLNWIVVLALLVISVVVTRYARTISIKSQLDSKQEVYIFRKDQSPPSVPEVVAPDATFRRTFWFGKSDFIVQATGFPEKSVQAHPWRRQSFVLPYDFTRRAILLRVTTAAIDRIANSPRTLIITVGEQKCRVENWRGNSVWIGCDPDIQIPAPILNKWREVARPTDGPYFEQWSKPMACKPLPDLRSGIQIQVEQLRDGKRVGEVRSITVQPSGDTRSPQVENYDVY